MKTMKKAMAVAAAIGITVTGSGMSYAAETSAADTSVSYESKNLNNGGGVDSVITGHIQITQISVKVPVKSSFDVDPTKAVTASDLGDVQMGSQAENYTITNLSTVPLQVAITKVTAGSGITLVQNIDALNQSKHVMFTIGADNEAKPGLQPGTDDDKWLKSGELSSPYAISTTGKNVLQPADPNNTDDSLTMKVYAVTRTGWMANDSFTVTPTFTVSLYTAP